jgi:CheY-like chemotaxis protein
VTTGNRHPWLGGVRSLDAMKRDLALRKIRVAFVTALLREDLWGYIRNTGRDPEVEIAGYVWKSFDPAELIAEIRRVAEQAGPRLSRSGGATSTETISSMGG